MQFLIFCLSVNNVHMGYQSQIVWLIALLASSNNNRTPELAMELGMDGQLDSDGSSSSSSLEQVEIAEKPQWDCESILSTHSNLYNHPTKISESPSRSKVSVTHIGTTYKVLVMPN